jgi:sensor c-di-GMP phosphodiesterase-like protein
MMRILKQRVLVTLVATLLAGACGTLAGYLAGCAVAIHLAKGTLKAYAARTIQESEVASRESRALLAALNASPYSFCSDAEVAYFRELVYQSQYLKEAGRIRNGKVQCSARLGRLNQPIQVAKPDFSQQDGTEAYWDFSPFQIAGLRVVSLKLGESFVVFSPFTRLHREFPPIHYTGTARDNPDRQSTVLTGQVADATWAALTADGETRIGDTLYATRCSSRYFNCVTDYIYIPDALQIGRPELTEFMVLGGVIGAIFGFICSLIYRRSRSMEQQLRRAIAADRLRVVYQPIVSMPGRRIVGAEALVRWTDEEGFAVGPDVFVKLAEERGFVGLITKLVLRRSLRDFAETLRIYPDFQLSINVAAADLADPAFLPMLEGAVQQAKVVPRSLAIEITENSAVRYTVAMETILLLRHRGYAVHIDDFGTGYSSLAYLNELSVDAIKIDKSFTRAIGTDSVIGSIMPQILSIALALHLEVIVEGIETEIQAAYFANAAGNIFAQGWLFGHPVSIDEFLRILIEDEVASLVPVGDALESTHR